MQPPKAEGAGRARGGGRSSPSLTRAVEKLVRAAVHLPDAAMDRTWSWGKYEGEGLRFALLVTHHELRDLAVRLDAARQRAGRAPGEIERIAAQYHEAYRDLTGLLHRVRDDELDREPVPGQWPIRAALRHVVGAQYGFSAVVEIALDAHRRGVAQEDPTDEAFEQAKAQPEPLDRIVAGGRDAVASALFEAHRRARRAMAQVGDDQLELPARFWDGDMPLRFRLHRFEAHLRQHTIQVEKTLVGIKHPATEAERLVRLIHNALAGVESAAADGLCEDERAKVAAAIAARVADVSAP